MATADRARARMVDALVRAGRVRSPAVEDALRTVPRHLFLPGLPLSEAYADEAVAVAFDGGVATSSASQPSMMAIMLEQLALWPGQRVLEIGAGTGYNAAMMARIVGPDGAVTAVDIDDDLVARAALHLAAAGVAGVDLVAADGAFGHPPGAPYDRIVLTVGSADIRPEWVAQLAPGGRLLLPLEVRGSQLSAAFDLGPDGVLRSNSVRSCAFIRLRGIGAGSASSAPLPGSPLSLQVPADLPAADPAGVVAALAAPGPPRDAPVPLGPADVWDGFGLWLALTEPGTCRLLAADEDTGLPDDLLPIGAGWGTVAIAGPAEGAEPGVAAVVVRPGRTDPGRRGTVAVRPFGPGGEQLATRLLAAMQVWRAAGTPSASAWRLTVVPATGEPAAPSGPAVVTTEHCRMLVELAG